MIVIADAQVRGGGLTDFVFFSGEYVFDAARGYPERVAAKRDPIPAGDRRAESVPTIREPGHVVARDPRHGLLLAGLRVGERRPQPAHIGLGGGEADDGISHPIWRGVENTAGELAGERALIARVVAGGRRGWAFERDRHRLAHRVVCGADVARQMDVGDVEGVADFVEARGLAVVGKLGFHLEPRCREEVAQGVFVFVAVESALGGATLAGDGFLFGRCEGRGETLEEGRELGGCGPIFLFLRRHLAGLETVVDVDPMGKIHAVPGPEGERGEVEAAFFLHVVVAARAIFRREGGRVESGCGGKSGGEENDEGDAGEQRSGRAGPGRQAVMPPR